jgi:hypothetical protein
MVNRTFSPLKGKPLRLPGQSADEQLFDLQYDKVLTPILIAAMLVLLAVVEWLRFYLAAPPAPWLYSVFALGAVVYAAYRVARVRPHIAHLRQGRDGERVVGQYLERLREKGYQVFHDVVGERFNVDHVLIGPGGIFSVETKTYSKPVGREPKIEFDGEVLKLQGVTPERNAVVQAKAQASWLRELLSESTGRKLRVRPVILFPGWYVQHAAGAKRDVWVLNPKALGDFLDHEEQVMSEADVKLASTHLSRFVRGTPLPL